MKWSEARKVPVIAHERRRNAGARSSPKRGGKKYTPANFKTELTTNKKTQSSDI